MELSIRKAIENVFYENHNVEVRHIVNQIWHYVQEMEAADAKDRMLRQFRRGVANLKRGMGSSDLRMRIVFRENCDYCFYGWPLCVWRMDLSHDTVCGHCGFVYRRYVVVDGTLAYQPACYKGLKVVNHNCRTYCSRCRVMDTYTEDGYCYDCHVWQSDIMQDHIMID